MDTDVEVLKPLDEFLKYEGVSGFESSTQIPTGLMASRDLHPLVKEWLDDYAGKHFIKEDGSFDLTTNVRRITNICLKHGFVANGKLQTVADFTFFPSDVFCPKSHETGVIICTENTVTIHHFAGSWVPEYYKVLNEKLAGTYRKFGKNKFSDFFAIIYSGFYRLKNTGLRKTFRHYFSKGAKGDE